VDEELGRTLAQEQNGVLVVADIDPEGDGVVLARTARLDRREQLTPQVKLALEAAETAGLRPKMVVACAGVSGVKPLDQRPGLVAVLEALDQDGGMPARPSPASP
jgi:hypothetical protein